MHSRGADGTNPGGPGPELGDGLELSDDTLAAVEHLSGPGALPMLGAAVAELGAEMLGARLAQLVHEPGRSCTATYAVRVLWHDGVESTETFVATTSVEGPPEGAAILRTEDGQLEVGLWRYPFDPPLPGLAVAAQPETAQERFGHLVGGHCVTSVMTYRAGRRAVIRLQGDRDVVFVKVVLPRRAERLVRVHEALHAAGAAVPQVLDADVEAGIVVLSALEGASWRDQLLSAQRGGPEPGGVAARLVEQLGIISDVTLDGRPARRSPLRDVGAHAATIVAISPQFADLTNRTLTLIEPDAPSGVAEELVTVHGDLHDAQAMVRPDGRVGILDLDDVGAGFAHDDAANMIGHAVVLGCVAAEHGNAAAVERIATWAGTTFLLSVRAGLNAEEITRRAAAVALSLATGPARELESDWRRSTELRLIAAGALASGIDPGHVVRKVSERRHQGFIPTRDN